MNGEDINSVSPTVGFEIKTLYHNDFKLNLWDVGGQKTIRAYWRNYYEETDGIIWVVDSLDSMRLESCKEEFSKILLQEVIKFENKSLSFNFFKKLAGASLMIFANKQDCKDSLKPNQIREFLGLDKIENRHWFIQGCSAFTGEGLFEGIEWLINDIAKRIYLF